MRQSADSRSAQKKASPGETIVPVRQMAAPGYYSIPEEFGRLIDKLDRLLRLRILRAFNGIRPVSERRYPTLLSMEALHRSGYPVNFPNLISVIAHLDDSGTAGPSAVASVLRDRGPDSLGLFALSDAGLPPTMCLHVYEQFRLDQASPDDYPAVTARGPAFRREVDTAEPLKRLSEFTIRECVFFGDREAVWRNREAAQDMAVAATDDMGLPGRLAPATDAFFASPDGDRNRRIQRMTGAKYELLCPAGDGTEIAVASFNYSGRKFVESYDLNAGPQVVSGCLGFGLERLALVLTRQHESVSAADAVVTQVLEADLATGSERSVLGNPAR
jgi:seryl-tRNA synthetase